MIINMMQNLMIGEAIVDPILSILLDIDFIIMAIGRFTATKKCEKGDITQKELNAAYEYPEFSFVSCYAHAYVLLLLSFTFAPVLPHVTIIAMIGMINVYIFNKYLITNRSSFFKDMSSDLSFHMIKNLNILMIVYFLSDYIWDKFYVDNRVGYESNAWVTFATLLVLVIYFFLPIHWIV